MRRVLFTGSRNWTDAWAIVAVIQTLPPDAVVIHGACFRKRKPGEPERSLDAIVDRLARARGLRVESFPADWERHGNRAGPIRNQETIDEGRPTECHAFPLPDSRGTWDMVRRCEKAGVPVTIHKNGEAK